MRPTKLSRSRREQDLHERCADWLEQRGANLVEQDEVIGYHLERASRCKDELGETDPELARRAGDRLAAAGRRALARGDSRAARGLLARSLALTRAVRLDIELELDLCECEYLRSPEAAAAIAESAAERASRWVIARARRSRGSSPPITDRTSRSSRGSRRSRSSRSALSHCSRTWKTCRPCPRMGGARRDRESARSVRGSAQSAEKVLHHSRLAGRPRTALLLLEYALVYGPCPADEAIRCSTKRSGDVSSGSALAPLAAVGDARPLRGRMVDGARKQRTRQSAQRQQPGAVPRADRHARGRSRGRRRVLAGALRSSRAAWGSRGALDCGPTARTLAVRARPARRSRAAGATRAGARGRERHRDAGALAASGGPDSRVAW